jgi:hypothetical protein
MKLIQVEHSNLSRTPVTSHFQRRAGNADTTKERTIADAVLIVALVAAIPCVVCSNVCRAVSLGSLRPASSAR